MSLCFLNTKWSWKRNGGKANPKYSLSASIGFRSCSPVPDLDHSGVCNTMSRGYWINMLKITIHDSTIRKDSPWRLFYSYCGMCSLLHCHTRKHLLYWLPSKHQYLHFRVEANLAVLLLTTRLWLQNRINLHWPPWTFQQNLRNHCGWRQFVHVFLPIKSESITLMHDQVYVLNCSILHLKICLFVSFFFFSKKWKCKATDKWTTYCCSKKEL